jgi:hypothetical protein
MEALKAHYGTGGFVEVVERDTLPVPASTRRASTARTACS